MALTPQRRKDIAWMLFEEKLRRYVLDPRAKKVDPNSLRRELIRVGGKAGIPKKEMSDFSDLVIQLLGDKISVS